MDDHLESRGPDRRIEQLGVTRAVSGGSGTPAATKYGRVGVFCGASKGGSPAFCSAAYELGTLLARTGIGVVYGAGGTGVMGALSDAVMAEQGDITGVIPEVLMSRERGREDLPDLRVVESIQARKSLMYQLSSAFIVLPGGLGTLEELFEVVTFTRLGLHEKPIVMLNVDGYFNPLFGFLDHAAQHEFLLPHDRHVLQVAQSPGEALALAFPEA